MRFVSELLVYISEALCNRDLVLTEKNQFYFILLFHYNFWPNKWRYFVGRKNSSTIGLINNARSGMLSSCVCVIDPGVH